MGEIRKNKKKVKFFYEKLTFHAFKFLPETLPAN